MTTKIPRDNQEENTGINRRQFVKAGVGITAGLMLSALSQGATGATAVSQKTKKVLIINAHQVHKGISEGRLNKTMAALISEEMANKGFSVQTTYIEKGYDIEAEVDKHLNSDVIITQSPVFWFGTPWIYKKYIDEVFTEGLIKQSFLSGDGRSKDDPTKQYGSGGKLLGKQYMLSLTMNSPEEAFNDPGQRLHRGHSLDDLFANNTANYRFCGAEVLPVFACYDVVSNPQVSSDIIRLKQHLKTMFG